MSYGLLSAGWFSRVFLNFPGRFDYISCSSFYLSLEVSCLSIVVNLIRTVCFCFSPVGYLSTTLLLLLNLLFLRLSSLFRPGSSCFLILKIVIPFGGFILLKFSFLSNYLWTGAFLSLKFSAVCVRACVLLFLKLSLPTLYRTVHSSSQNYCCPWTGLLVSKTFESACFFSQLFTSSRLVLKFSSLSQSRVLSLSDCRVSFERFVYVSDMLWSLLTRFRVSQILVFVK